MNIKRAEEILQTYTFEPDEEDSKKLEYIYSRIDKWSKEIASEMVEEAKRIAPQILSDNPSTPSSQLVTRVWDKVLKSVL